MYVCYNNMEWSDMSKLKSNTRTKSSIEIKVVTFIGMLTVMLYMIISINSLAHIALNFSILTANSNMFSIIFHTLVYLLVIGTGTLTIIKSKNPYYMIITLVTILIIY